MVRRAINWTEKANLERKEILDYWICRNKSKTYGTKLNKLFIEVLRHVAKNPNIGRKTDFENVRVKIVRSYLIFYEYNEKQLKVLSVWDGRRDDAKFKIR